MEFGRCRLCLQERDLCNSHIIPDFVLQNSFPDSSKHRAVLITSKGVQSKPAQQGPRECLLCRECEDRFQKWEVYIAKPPGVKILTLPGGFKVESLDYTKTKMLYLSILWRLSICSDPVGEVVKLGRHEEVLRKRLLSGDPGNPEDYPFVLFCLIKDGKIVNGITGGVVKSKYNSHVAYTVNLDNFLALFLVSSHAKPDELKPFFLKPDGTLMVPHYPAERWYQDVIQKHVKGPFVDPAWVLRDRAKKGK